MSERTQIPFSSRLSQNWNDFVNKYDLGALPAFAIFFVVVSLGMLLNYLSMRKAIGDAAALLVSGLFEFGILGWKWTSSRKRNNDTQNELVNWATWLSVFLAVAMLVINLFRTTIENRAQTVSFVGATFNGWEIAAYVTIGLAALVHIIFYLAFDQNDTDKEYARLNKRSKNDIVQRSRKADDLVMNAEADLRIIDKITNDLARLRKTYTALPQQQLEIVLENARQALLVEYKASRLVDAATSALADINQDNRIGAQPVQVPTAKKAPENLNKPIKPPSQPAVEQSPTPLRLSLVGNPFLVVSKVEQNFKDGVNGREFKLLRVGEEIEVVENEGGNYLLSVPNEIYAFAVVTPEDLFYIQNGYYQKEPVGVANRNNGTDPTRR